ncbi:MAG: DUF4159 domain-containing protein, partial [Planctomycetota bacterium]|nr:DUF4159 domain-containing protein [Planctomycetota bacterium]
MLKRTVAWQIIDVDHPVSQWHDAPILVISGAKAPTFTDAELDKLRAYVQQGGTILSVRECSGEGFGTGMREVYRRLFPDYELKACGRDHPLYAKSVYFDVPTTIPLAVISNGVRPLAIHTDADLMLSWQSLRTTSQKEHFELAMNVMRYVAAGPHLMRHRGVSHWPAPAGVAAVRTAQLVRLRHSGPFDPEPMAYGRLSLLMQSLAGTELDVTGPIPIADLPAGGA